MSIRPPSLNAGRRLDLGDDVLEEQVGGVQAAGVVERRAFGVFGSEKPPERLLPWQTASCASLQLFGEIQLNAGVVDSRSAGRGTGRWRESNRSAMCVRVAVARLQDRLEPREREVLRHVLVGRVRAARVGLRRCCRSRRAAIRRAAVLRSRPSASGRLRLGVAEVLGVALPAHVRGVELVEQRLHARGVHAAVGPGGRVRALPPRPSARSSGSSRSDPDVSTCPGSGRSTGSRLRVGLRRLPADQRDVVVQAEVAGAVVVLQQHALGRQRLPQVRVVVQAGERRVVRLVLEDDQPDVLDLPGLDPESVGIRAGRAGDARRAR